MRWLDELPAEEIPAPPIILRRYRPEDAPALYEAVTESLEILRPWMGWATPDPSKAGMAIFLFQAVEEFEAGTSFHYAMWSLDDELVGGCSLGPGAEVGTLEVGYWVRAGYLRQGLATAAARALTDAGLSLPGVRRIEIGCDMTNVASAAVAQGLGFGLDRVEVRAPSAPGETHQRTVWTLERPPSPR